MKNNSVLIGFFAVVIICLVVTCAFLGTALMKSKNPPESVPVETNEPEEIRTDESETSPESAEIAPDETEPAETQPAETQPAETSAPETQPAETEPEGPTFADTLPVEPDRIPEYNGQTWNLFLVNLWNKLPDDFTVDLTYLKNGHAVDSRAYPDLQDMMDDCRAAGLSPLICSSYRTYEKQVTLYDNQVAKYLAKGYTQDQAEKEAAMWVAIPGTSEHHTGLALDIVSLDYQYLDEKQEETPEQQWLLENAWLYGWILRYPPEKVDLTGIAYEPWHYRYVGKEVAKEIHDAGICLEEYLMPAEKAEN